jgi:hypothetical protein
MSVVDVRGRRWVKEGPYGIVINNNKPVYFSVKGELLL